MLSKLVLATSLGHSLFCWQDLLVWPVGTYGRHLLPGIFQTSLTFMTELRAEKNEQVNWKSKKNILLNTLKKNIFLLVPFQSVHFSFTWSTLSPSITGSDVLFPMQSFPLALLNLTNQSICHSCWKGSRQGDRVGMAINMKPRRISMAWPKTPCKSLPLFKPISFVVKSGLSLRCSLLFHLHPFCTMIPFLFLNVFTQPQLPT